MDPPSRVTRSRPHGFPKLLAARAARGRGCDKPSSRRDGLAGCEGRASERVARPTDDRRNKQMRARASERASGEREMRGTRYICSQATGARRLIERECAQGLEEPTVKCECRTIALT